MPPPLIMPPDQLNLDNVVADKEGIRKVLLHRYEMEQIDRVCLLDTEQQMIAGYKDVRDDEFWVRGHFPEFPLLPGVLICEAAAQLVSYYVITQKVVEDPWLGFGGMDEVRFRGPVRPGDRLVLIGKAIRLKKRQTICAVQGFVDSRMVFHGNIIGVPIRPALET